jgi:bifunctional DNase/RNase
MDIEVELSRIVINEQSDQQLIVLRERGGEKRSVPIVIGIVEIFAIDRRLKGIEPPRPMTHDLMASVINHLGAKIDKIVINDLKEHTFYAQIHLRDKEGALVEVDSRPSDAIAVSVAMKAPIFVADHVLTETAGQ